MIAQSVNYLTALYKSAEFGNEIGQGGHHFGQIGDVFADLLRGMRIACTYGLQPEFTAEAQRFAVGFHIRASVEHFYAV